MAGLLQVPHPYKLNQEGLDQIVALLTTTLFEMRLGRPITKTERATLVERLRAPGLGPGPVGAVVRTYTVEAIAAWLAAPNAP